ncbi:hypothetical protein EHQ68_00785 [Leptospira congkakensis]|uniref:Lipoprotein n=1 Tax=Leptospira congkakensis TaxID=2484932 RepID=A0A4Z1A2L0_9LEPT|nr:hypothetical protein [Leptospira congkakensis]TGL87930.1 hypothetical protein EHQ69_17720 [Leptospira congkakensis]TGL92707.1 hypothetical protein EHQ68_00785 [Leptospira congkakensis]TGL96080.1 hypothetical protein EHQ70_13390 [Leptospira congkakensis]
MKKLIYSITTLTLLNCAIPARVDKMVVSSVKANNKINNEIFINESKGGEITLPFWIPKISNENFTQAIKNSVLNSEKFQKISDNNSNHWRLEVEITNWDHPWFGIDFTHSLTVRYILYNENNIQVYNKEIYSIGTATMEETLIGVYRANRANEYAAKENIRLFLLDLDNVK